MFAVIKTGGKQYRVAKDDMVTVERVAEEAGSTVNLDQVLMVGAEGAAPKVGAPTVEGASVAAEIVEHTRGPKIRVFKKKRRKNYRRTAGHRQDLTVLRVTDIQVDGKSSAGDSGETATKKPASRNAQKKATQAAVTRQSRAKSTTAKQRNAGTASQTERKAAAANNRKARGKQAENDE
ncbi:50S ribosomal protein L21 [Ferruginivarius sediminum]|uniref:Large ribosomal subunit protein bL21 n=1 Tax=Ferruginivarius sediminum TaxID=2661937 RepID=A0A369T6Y3_9PROT|nr:50S ribosomal protein L21 [Ferruginivarius sediminum]